MKKQYFIITLFLSIIATSNLLMADDLKQASLHSKEKICGHSLISKQKLKGYWERVTWSERLKGIMGFMKIKEKKYEWIGFKDKKYFELSSNKNVEWDTTSLEEMFKSMGNLPGERHGTTYRLTKGCSQFLIIKYPKRDLAWGISLIDKTTAYTKKKANGEVLMLDGKAFFQLKEGDLIFTL